MSTFVISGMPVTHCEKDGSVFDAGVWNLESDQGEEKVMVFD